MIFFSQQFWVFFPPITWPNKNPKLGGRYHSLKALPIMLGNALCETPEVSLGNVPNIMGKDETIPYNIKFWGGRFHITKYLRRKEKKEKIFNRDFGHYYECVIIVEDYVIECGQENDIISHPRPQWLGRTRGS